MDCLERRGLLWWLETAFRDPELVAQAERYGAFSLLAFRLYYLGYANAERAQNDAYDLGRERMAMDLAHRKRGDGEAVALAARGRHKRQRQARKKQRAKR
jgi:hypothetical protein